MSSRRIKAGVDVDFNASKFGQGAKKAQDELNKVKTTGTGAFRAVSGGINTSKTSMNEFAASSRNALQGMKRLETGSRSAMSATQISASKAAASVRTVGVAAQASSIGMLALATSAVGLTASVAGLATSLSSLPRTALAIEKAVLAVDQGLVSADQATITLRNDQVNLAKVLKTSGKQSLAYRDAQEKVAATEANRVNLLEDLRIKQEEVNIATEDYTNNLTLLTVSVATTVLTSFTTVLAVLTQLAAASNVTTAAYVRQKLAAIGLTGANIAAAISMRALTAASFAFAASPLGIVLLAASAAFLVFESNILGVRDALSGLVGFEVPSLFSEMAKLGTAATDLNSELTNTGEIVTTVGGKTSTFSGQLDTGTAAFTGFSDAALVATTKTGNFGLSLDAAGTKMIPFVTALFDASGNLVDLTRHMGTQNLVAETWGKFILDNSGKLIKETNALARNTDAIKENTAAAEDNLKKNDELIRQSTRLGFVTQQFFNSLPPELRGNFRLSSGTGAPFDKTGALGFARARRAAEKAFRNSDLGVKMGIIRSIIAGATGGFSGFRLDRGQSKRLRNRGIGAIQKVDVETIRLAAQFGLIGENDGSPSGIIRASKLGIAEMNAKLARVGLTLAEILASSGVPAFVRKIRLTGGGRHRGPRRGLSPQQKHTKQLTAAIRKALNRALLAGDLGGFAELEESERRIGFFGGKIDLLGEQTFTDIFQQINKTLRDRTLIDLNNILAFRNQELYAVIST